MLTTLGIVQPSPSSLAANGLAARRLGGKSVLEWVIRRATDCQRLDRLIVVVAAGAEEQAVAGLVPPDVSLFVSAAGDVLGRTIAALEKYPAQAIVRVRADTPFIDPVLIDRLVSAADEHPDCDYIAYAARDGGPAVASCVGLFAEWCRADALYRAHAEAVDPLDREMATRYLYAHPERFTLRLLAAPLGLDRDDVRLKLDSEEDWEHAQAIFDALGPDSLDWHQIARLLDQQPAMRSRMALLNRRMASVS